MWRSRQVLAGSSLLLLWGLLPISSGALAPDAGSNSGFIYGTVTTQSGTEYKGFLRWGTEEAFWDDLFHSLKQDLPYLEDLERVERRDRRRSRDRSFRIFGRRIQIGSGGVQSSRIFISRFGDIQEIVINEDDGAEILMKSGVKHQVRGYSNDVSGKIHVRDDKMGEIDLNWERIESIKFMAAPRNSDPGVQRLYGKLESEVGDFEGFIQWDKQECLSSDLLDGETEDGKMCIEMGNIRSIERRSRRSCVVELGDERQVTLRGSNDVNSENRGIMVEDPRFGRVTVKWDEFDKLTFSAPPGSGEAYDDYQKSGLLRGTVTVRDGSEHRGQIVFDLDESESWEILNGSLMDADYDIPFANIESIEPIGSDASLVVLRSGEKLELEDSQDVTDRNDGILIFVSAGDDPIYVSWDEVERIQFDK